MSIRSAVSAALSVRIVHRERLDGAADAVPAGNVSVPDAGV